MVFSQYTESQVIRRFSVEFSRVVSRTYEEEEEASSLSQEKEFQACLWKAVILESFLGWFLSLASEELGAAQGLWWEPLAVGSRPAQGIFHQGLDGYRGEQSHRHRF